MNLNGDVEPVVGPHPEAVHRTIVRYIAVKVEGLYIARQAFVWVVYLGGKFARGQGNGVSCAVNPCAGERNAFAEFVNDHH